MARSWPRMRACRRRHCSRSSRSTSRLTVDRLALGVGDGKFYKMGLLGKDVDVLVTLELLADKK